MLWHWTRVGVFDCRKKDIHTIIFGRIEIFVHTASATMGIRSDSDTVSGFIFANLFISIISILTFFACKIGINFKFFMLKRKQNVFFFHSFLPASIDHLFRTLVGTNKASRSKDFQSHDILQMLLQLQAKHSEFYFNAMVNY